MVMGNDVLVKLSVAASVMVVGPVKSAAAKVMVGAVG